SSKRYDVSLNFRSCPIINGTLEMPLDRSALLQAVRFALIASAVIATGCDSSTPVAPTAQSTNAPDPLRAP
ncbi:hypothetical protein, partial [Escherichia coli]